MNWVGGVRRRVLQQEEERRRQQIFFARHVSSAAVQTRSCKEQTRTGRPTHCDLSDGTRSEHPILHTGPHPSKIKPQHWRKEEMIYKRIRTGSCSSASTASRNKIQTVPAGQDSHSATQGRSLYMRTRHEKSTRNEGLTEDKRVLARIKPTSIHGPFSKYLLKLEREAIERRLATESKYRNARKYQETKSLLKEDRAYKKKGNKALTDGTKCNQDESTSRFSKNTKHLKVKGERELKRKGEAPTSRTAQMKKETKDQKKSDSEKTRIKNSQEKNFKQLVNLSLSGTELKFSKIPNWISSNANTDASVHSESSCSVLTRRKTEKERNVETGICPELQAAVESSSRKRMIDLQKSQRNNSKDCKRYQQVTGKVSGKEGTNGTQSGSRGHSRRSTDRLHTSCSTSLERCESEKENQIDETCEQHDSSKEKKSKPKKQRSDTNTVHSQVLKKDIRATYSCQMQQLSKDKDKEVIEFQGPRKFSYGNRNRQRTVTCLKMHQQNQGDENREALQAVARCNKTEDSIKEKIICEFSTPTLLAGAPRLRQVLTLSPDRHKGHIWAPMFLPANQSPMFTAQPKPQEDDNSVHHFSWKTEKTETGDKVTASIGNGKQNPDLSLGKCTQNCGGFKEKLNSKWENDRLQMLLGTQSQRSVSKAPCDEISGIMSVDSKGYQCKEDNGNNAKEKMSKNRKCKPAIDPLLVTAEISIEDGTSDTQTNKLTEISNPLETKENHVCEEFQTRTIETTVSKPRLSGFTRKVMHVDSGLGFARERRDKTPYLDRSICTPWLSGFFFNTPGSNKSSSKTPTDPTIEGSLENIFGSQGGAESINVGTPGCPPESFQDQFINVHDYSGDRETDDIPCHFSFNSTNSTMVMDSAEQHSFISTSLHDQDCQLPVTMLDRVKHPLCHGVTERTNTSVDRESHREQSCKSVNKFQVDFAGNTQLCYKSCNSTDTSQEESHIKNPFTLKYPQRRSPTNVHVKENGQNITDELEYFPDYWRSTVTTSNSLQIGHHMAVQNRRLAEIGKDTGFNTHEYKYISSIPLLKTLDGTGKLSPHMHQECMNPFVDGAGNPYIPIHDAGTKHVTSSHVTESTTLKHSQINTSVTRILPSTICSSYLVEDGQTVDHQHYPGCENVSTDVQGAQEVVDKNGQVFFQRKEIIYSQEGEKWYESRKRTDADPIPTTDDLGVPPSSSKGLPEESGLQKLFLSSNVETNQEHSQVNPELAARQFREVMGLPQPETSQESWEETPHASQLTSSSLSSSLCGSSL